MQVSNTEKLIFMMGPCAIENESHALKTAAFLKNLSEKLGFTLIYKSSFDKANRTSIDGYRSVGLKEGGRILSKVKEELGLPIVTDIHEAWQAAEAAQFADVLQIPAFLCRQTDLLVAAGKTGKIVNIKKGQFFTAEAMVHSANKVASTGNKNIWLCERGFTHGYGNLVVDYRNFPIMKETGYPVIYDATHAVQRPSSMGTCSGGDRQFVSDLAIAAVSQGIAGLFIEVHEDPDKAPCDGPNSLRLSQLEDFLKYILELDAWVKSTPRPEVF